MEITKPTIKFYQKRTFSEKMSASFDFLQANAKPLFKLCLYLILPVAILQGFAMNSYLGNVFAFSENPYAYDSLSDAMGLIGSSMVTILMSMLGGIIMSSIIYSSVQYYNMNGSMEGATLETLKDRLINNAGRIFVVILLSILLMIAFIIVISLFTVLTPFTLILTIPLLFACIIPLSLAPSISVFEKTPATGAIGKAFSLGFKTWGALFGIMFVMNLLAGIVQSVGSMPWYGIYFTQNLLTVIDPSAETSTSIGQSIMQYITCVIMLFVTYISSSFVIMGTVYHYSSANEAAESVSVNEDLENFESL